MGFLLLVDLFVFPSILMFPKYLAEHTIDALGIWLDDLNPFQAIIIVVKDPFLLKAWGFSQVIILSLTMLTFWKKDSTSSKNPNRVTPNVGGPAVAGNNEYGSARWQTEEETNRTSFVWQLKTAVIAGGIVLGAVLSGRKPHAWIDTKDVNTMIIGTTRSGKTRRLVFPTIWQLAYAGESILMTDPKGELYARSAPYLREMGYTVRVVDYRKPGWGSRWNAMQLVLDALKEGDVAAASSHAWTAANMFVYQKPGSDQAGGDSIWKDGAESVIAALILVVAMEAPHDNQKHMYSVYKTLAELGKSRKVRIGNQIQEYVALNDYMDQLPEGHPARDAYATAALAPERTRGSFFSNVASLLRLFADPAIQYLTAEQDHVLHDIGKEKTAVFLIIPDENKTRHPLAALYVDQTYQALVEFANNNGGRLPIRVNMLLDEFGNMPPFKDFDNKLTVSLGRGIRWNIILQDFTQTDVAYGEMKSTVIRGNCHNLIYLLTTDDKTAQKISDKLGKYTIRSDSSSYTEGKTSVSKGESFGLTGRSLLTQDEILRWPEDLSLVIRARQNPAYLPLPDLSLWPADEELIPDGGEVIRKIEPVKAFVPDMAAQTHQSDPDDSEEEEEPSYMMDVT